MSSAIISRIKVERPSERLSKSRTNNIRKELISENQFDPPRSRPNCRNCRTRYCLVGLQQLLCLLLLSTNASQFAFGFEKEKKNGAAPEENNVRQPPNSAAETCEEENQSSTSSRSSSENNNNDRDDNDADDDTQNILAQLDFSYRAGVDPITIVTTQIPPHYQRGVVYLGEEPLLPNKTIGLYRALLVEKKTWYRWLSRNQQQQESYLQLNPDVWYDFWSRYAVEFTNEISNTMTDDDDDDDDDLSSLSWIAIPVGDLGKGVDEPTWWTHGILSSSQLEEAIQAINAKVLVDWQRLAQGNAQNYLFFNAHLLNEPSPAVDHDNSQQSDEYQYFDHDEEENVSHLTGSGCPFISMEEEDVYQLGEDRKVSPETSPQRRRRAKWCGAAFEAKTSKIVYPGEQLVWCYGESYKRDYPVAKICLNDNTREK